MDMAVGGYCGPEDKGAIPGFDIALPGAAAAAAAAADDVGYDDGVMT